MKSVALLESILRARKLDHTLTSARPIASPEQTLESGILPLDDQLEEGFPRGHLSEIVGARSSGRTMVMAAVLGSATRRGEVAALVDVLDHFDPPSGAAAGIELSHLLWIRGRFCGPRSLPDVLKRAIKAMGFVLEAGGFGCAVLDLADVPIGAIRCLPLTTWLRLARTLEGSKTVGLLVGSEPIARSVSGRTVIVRAAVAGGRWVGSSERSRPSTSSLRQAQGVPSSSRDSGRAEPFDSGHPEQGRRMTVAQDRPVEARVFGGLEIEARVISAKSPGTGWIKLQEPGARSQEPGGKASGRERVFF